MRRLLLACICASVLLFGCGGSGNDKRPEATSSPQSRDAFIQLADAICRELNVKLRHFAREVRKQDRLRRTNREEYLAREAALFRAVRIETGSAIVQLRALEPPAKDKTQVERYLLAREEASASNGRIADASERGDITARNALIKDARRADAESRALARAYGFEECGKRGGTSR